MSSFFVLILLGGASLGWFMPELAALGNTLCLIALAGLLLRYTLLVSIGIMLQNNPAYTRTVPALQKQLWRLSAALLIGVTLLYGLLGFALIGHFWLNFLSAMLILCAICWYNGAVAGVGISILMFFSKTLFPLFQLAESNLAYRCVFILVTLLFLYFSVGHLIKNGGDAHMRAYKSILHLLRQSNPSDNAKNNWAQFEKIFQFMNYFYFRGLNKAIGNTKLVRADHLLTFVFGPGVYWTTELINVALFWLFIAFSLFPSNQEAFHLFPFKAIALGLPLFSGFSFAVAAKTELFRTRREQSLIRLVPAMPSGLHINACFLQFLLKRFTTSWMLIGLQVFLLIAISWKLGETQWSVY
ncbi:MAG: hypothetical protein K2P84_01570, partial [Undibacterium sp.]|nr:hypothetical protein [Undibacterium sp.]